ncbi:unnamed protein product [Urochloa humidicola]
MADDLHHRWLPREIFGDIGIVDTEAVAAGILGGRTKVCPLAPPPSPPPPPATKPASVAAPGHGAQGSAKDDPSTANGKPAAKKWSPGSYSNRPIIWSYLSTKVVKSILARRVQAHKNSSHVAKSSVIWD